MEYLTKDTHLDYAEAKEGAYTELYGLNSFPKMGGSPNKVDVSNMRDSIKRSINGLQEVDNLEFGFYYNNEKTTDDGNVAKKAFAKLKELEKAGKLVHWKLIYPDGSYYSWQGKPVVSMDAGNVGEAIKFTLSVSLETSIEFTDGVSEGE